MIAEPFQYVKEKHAQDVRIFHVLKTFHAKFAGTSATFPASRAYRAVSRYGVGRLPDPHRP